MRARCLCSLALIAALVLYCMIASAETPVPQKQGLHLSVQKTAIDAGSPVDLHWEIMPDGRSSVSIILGVIRPDNSIQYYKGPGKGFAAFKTIESSTRIVSDFPFNTAMSAVLSVTIPAEWPRGTYQFVAAVMDGKTLIETDYGNSFTVR